MIEGQFSTEESFVHSLDPRIKIIAALLFSVVVAVLSNFLVLLPGLAVSLFLIALAKLSLRKVFYRLLLVNGLILFLWIFFPFTHKGEALFSIGPLVGTKEGVLYAGRITIKCNAILLAMTALLGTTPVLTLGHAMSRLYLPDKLTHLFLFTYRYIHVIHREYIRLQNSMKIRAFHPGTNLHTYKTFAYMVGMLLVKSFDRAQRVHNAMLCRGFRGKFYSLREFSLQGKDIVFIVVMTADILAMGVLEWIKTI